MTIASNQKFFKGDNVKFIAKNTYHSSVIPFGSVGEVLDFSDLFFIGRHSYKVKFGKKKF